MALPLVSREDEAHVFPLSVDAIRQLDIKGRKAREKAIRQRMHTLHSFLLPSESKDSGLAQGSIRSVERLIVPNLKLVAKDAVLNEILCGENGMGAIRALGWVIFGATVEDESTILPEPLLDDDILVDLGINVAILRLRFSVATVPSVRQRSHSRTKGQEFGGLSLALLRDDDDSRRGGLSKRVSR